MGCSDPPADECGSSRAHATAVGSPPESPCTKGLFVLRVRFGSRLGETVLQNKRRGLIRSVNPRPWPYSVKSGTSVPHAPRHRQDQQQGQNEHRRAVHVFVPHSAREPLHDKSWRNSHMTVRRGSGTRLKLMHINYSMHMNSNCTVMLVPRSKPSARRGTHFGR